MHPPPPDPGAGRQRAMRTGHALRCSTLWATLPTSRAARSEWPREPISIRPARCSLAASRMRRAAEPYMVWRRSTRVRSPAASRSLAYCSASWIAPRSSSRWPSGGGWTSRAGWCRTSPAHLRGWLGWRQSPSAGAGLQGWLVCRPKTGRRTRARRTPSQLAPFTLQCAHRLAGSVWLSNHSPAVAKLSHVGRPNSELDASLPRSIPIASAVLLGSKALVGANGLVTTSGRVGCWFARAGRARRVAQCTGLAVAEVEGAGT
jgi:hypothetical protein